MNHDNKNDGVCDGVRKQFSKKYTQLSRPRILLNGPRIVTCDS